MEIAPNTHFDAYSRVTPKTESENRSREERLGFVYGSIAALIWGGYLAVSKLGIEEGLNAFDLAFLRYMPAGLVLLPWLLRNTPISLAGIGWRRGSVLALLIGPPFVLVGASGFHFAPLAHGAVIQLGMVTFMGIVLSAVVARENLTARRWIGLALIVGGLGVTAGPGMLSGGSEVWKGDLLFAIAGTMWAVFTVLQRRWGGCPIAATAVVSVLSAVTYVPAYLAIHGASNLFQVSVGTLLEQGIVLGILSGVVALFAFARTVETLGPARASLFPATAPAVAIVLGIPISGEVPTSLQIAGLIVLSLGLVIAMRKTTIQVENSAL